MPKYMTLKRRNEVIPKISELDSQFMDLICEAKEIENKS